MLARMVRKGDCVTWPKNGRYRDGYPHKGDGIVYRVTRVDGNLAHIETLDGKSSTLFIARFHDGLNQLVEIVDEPDACEQCGFENPMEGHERLCPARTP